MTNVEICLLISEALVPVYPRIVKTDFESIMTLNNWEMIAETRSYIFKWHSRCRQGRVRLKEALSSYALTRVSPYGGNFNTYKNSFDIKFSQFNLLIQFFFQESCSAGQQQFAFFNHNIWWRWSLSVCGWKRPWYDCILDLGPCCRWVYLWRQSCLILRIIVFSPCAF